MSATAAVKGKRPTSEAQSTPPSLSPTERWRADIESGRIKPDLKTLEALLAGFDLTGTADRELGRSWRADLNTTVTLAVMRILGTSISGGGHSHGILATRRVEALLYPAAVKQEPLVTPRGSARGAAAEQLLGQARQLKDPNDRLLGLVQILEETSNLLSISTKRLLIQEIMGAIDGVQGLKVNTILSCATSLAKVGAHTSGEKAFLAAVALQEVGVAGYMHDPIEYFAARLASKRGLRGLEALSNVPPSVRDRRYATYLLAVLKHDERRATSSLMVSSPADRARAVEVAVDVLCDRGEFARAFEVATKTAIRPLTLQTARPFFRSDCPKAIRDGLLADLPSVSTRIERIEIVCGLVELEGCKKRRAELLDKAEVHVGSLPYPNDFERRFLIDVARIAYVDRASVTGLAGSEMRARSPRRGEHSPRGWSRENAQLVAAGYHLAGDRERALKTLRTEKEETHYSFSSSLRNEYPEMFGFASWLCRFGAYQDALNTVLALPENSYGTRENQIYYIGHHAAQIGDAETAGKALAELPQDGLRALLIRLKRISSTMRS
jgi:hypothetical protein